jgi:hypothetical protein
VPTCSPCRTLNRSAHRCRALEALRSLLSDARAGDLAAQGDAVSEAKVSGWLSANMDHDLVDLVDGLENPGPRRPASPEARLLRDLGDVMLRSCIAPLDDVAARLGCSPEEVLAVAKQHADRFGLLQGPPVVLFAHVPAESLAEAAE